jgi:XRE family aerobic/anaerobic benzoate catabolism transcriptional regulator
MKRRQVPTKQDPASAALGAIEPALPPSARPAREDDADAYLVELGQRVRRMRALRGMSRKVLAEVSGVSERYIAQMESGLGNVSIMLLRRVAEATGAPIEDLVADPNRQHSDWPLIRDLLRQATPEMLHKVRAVLAGEQIDGLRLSQPPISVDRIALIGLRGAGKSTLGRLAAEQLGWPFVELNKEIEREHGFSVPEIFSLYGQDGYRRFELACLKGLIARPGPMVLATGGGIVAEPMTYDLLTSAFFTIWIKASPAEHMSRVRGQGDLRPMANDKAAMAELITILSSREPLYARARATIDTTGARLDESQKALVSLVRQYCSAGCPFVARQR